MHPNVSAVSLYSSSGYWVRFYYFILTLTPPHCWGWISRCWVWTGTGPLTSESPPGALDSGFPQGCLWSSLSGPPMAAEGLLSLLQPRTPSSNLSYIIMKNTCIVLLQHFDADCRFLTEQYLIPEIHYFASNCKNVELWASNFYHNFTQFKLSEKWKQGFKICKGPFSPFFTDINFLHLIRNLQYFITIILYLVTWLYTCKFMRW